MAGWELRRTIQVPNKLLLMFIGMALLLTGVCRAEDTTALEFTGDSILQSKIHLWKGQRFLDEGDLDKATEQFLLASKHMRTSPEPHFALARVYLRRSVMDAFLEFTTGLKYLFTDFFYQSLVATNAVLIVLIAFTLTIYLATITVIARHAREVAYSIVLSLSARFHGWNFKSIVLGLAVGLLIILSGKSIIGIVTWMTVIGAALSWRYAGSSERKIIAGFAAFLILFTLILGVTARIVSTQHPDSPLRLAALADRIDDERFAKNLNQKPGYANFDPITEFMRGLVYLREGQNAQAIERFTLASKFAKANASILNNLGVAYHGLGRYSEATAKFKEALRAGPREAVIHYNYSQTLNALLQYDLAQEELSTASMLDFGLTRRLVTSKDTPALIPMNLQTRVLWQLSMQPENQMVKGSYHPIETGIFGGLALLVICCVALVLMRNAKVPARCEVCGTLLQQQVTKRKRRDLACQTCEGIKVANADNHEQLDRALEARVKRMTTYEMIKRAVLGLLLPGTCHMMAGKRSKGLALSFVLFALALLALSGGKLVHPVPHFGPDRGSLWAMVLLLAVYGVYAWRTVVLAINSVNEE
jgi:Tfp pilus assembly protein PilF